MISFPVLVIKEEVEKVENSALENDSTFSKISLRIFAATLLAIIVARYVAAIVTITLSKDMPSIIKPILIIYFV